MTAPVPAMTINQWWCNGCGMLSSGMKEKHDSPGTGRRCEGTDVLLQYKLTPESLVALKAHRSR